MPTECAISTAARIGAVVAVAAMIGVMPAGAGACCQGWSSAGNFHLPTAITLFTMLPACALLGRVAAQWMAPALLRQMFTHDLALIAAARAAKF